MSRLFLTAIGHVISFWLAQAQPVTIVNASSHYQTSSGVIKPNQDIAIHSFELEVATSRTLVLDELTVSSYIINGQNLVIPPIDCRLKLKVEITISQGFAFVYSAKLTFNNITVPMEVTRKRRDLSAEPAVILGVGYSLDQSDLHYVMKEKFDSSIEVYDK